MHGRSGATSKVTATAKDSIGCVITYQWSAPSGVRESCAAEHGMDGANDTGHSARHRDRHLPDRQDAASDTVNITVTPRVVKTVTFEDVYFDFDRFADRCRPTHPDAGDRGDEGRSDAPGADRGSYL